MERREILKALLAAGASSAVNQHAWTRLLADAIPAPSSSDGYFLGLVGFIDEPGFPFATLLGNGLDGRLYTDLSTIGPETRVIPTEQFYVRTRASSLLPAAASWRLQLHKPAGEAVDLTLDDLQKRARPCGIHLMECSGNASLGHFGLMSVAEWDGVHMGELLDPIATTKKQRVLVAGFDRYPSRSSFSTAGASWIFTVAELTAAGAFLAMAMNGNQLTRDHGAPVRLVVPGWYGCCSIKWVTSIALVGNDVAATSQMREFASRTHQHGVPSLAREYQPAVIDPAATPIRVEKWRIGERTSYRVIGIYWGARRPATGLEIQFNPSEPFFAVDNVAQSNVAQDNDDGWSFWTHTWTPPHAGRYTIRLRLSDRAIRTRRLDSGHYRRAVVVREG